MRFATIADRPEIEALMNDPVERVWKSYDGAPRCDAGPYLEPPSFTLMCDEGCFPVMALGDGVYAVHANLRTECRGACAVGRSREATKFVFDNTDAHDLLAFVPETNPRARWVARQAGFKALRHVPSVWPVGGRMFGIDVLRLTKETP